METKDGDRGDCWREGKTKSKSNSKEMDNLDKENVIQNSSEIVPSSQNSQQLTSSCTQSKLDKLDFISVLHFTFNFIFTDLFLALDADDTEDIGSTQIENELKLDEEDMPKPTVGNSPSKRNADHLSDIELPSKIIKIEDTAEKINCSENDIQILDDSTKEKPAVEVVTIDDSLDISQEKTEEFIAEANNSELTVDDGNISNKQENVSLSSVRLEMDLP